jgi:hypothetical protein
MELATRAHKEKEPKADLALRSGFHAHTPVKPWFWLAMFDSILLLAS